MSLRARDPGIGNIVVVRVGDFVPGGIAVVEVDARVIGVPRER